MPHEPTTLDVRDLHVRYGAIAALRGIDLTLCPGQIVSVLGANGAGKSSLLNSVAGLVPATEGSIMLDDVEIAKQPPESILRRGLALVPEGRRVFPQLTVSENLRLGGATRRHEEQVQDREWLEEVFPQLREKRNQPAGTLSGGQQQMLAIARTLMSRPHYLLLDEPSLGLAPIIVSQIFDLIEDLRGKGLGILLVEQNVGRALDMADDVYVLATGRLVGHGTAEEVRMSGALRSAYFGAGGDSS